jgi:hypothetical protein
MIKYALSWEEKQEQYVADNGSHCPYCGSDALDKLELIETEGDALMTQIVICKACGKQWENVYALMEYISDDEELDESDGLIRYDYDDDDDDMDNPCADSYIDDDLNSVDDPDSDILVEYYPQDTNNDVNGVDIIDNLV